MRRSGLFIPQFIFTLLVCAFLIIPVILSALAGITENFFFGALEAADLSAEIDPDVFVRVGAPTGTAAFNLRVNATTVHRLIHWFKPRFFAEVADPVRLNELQKHLAHTQLIILDEVSMIGRQMMGRIDSRLNQAKARKNPMEYSLGGVSCVAVGDPAQYEAIIDQQIYYVKPHKETAS